MSTPTIDLRLGDCLKLMREIPDESIDVIVTSPPYNKKSAKRVSHHSDTWTGGGASISYGNFLDDLPEPEYQEWQIKIINEGLRVLKREGSFFYNHKNRTVNKGIISPYEWILKSNAIIKQEIIWDRSMIVEIDNVRFYPKTERIFWLIKDRVQPKFNGDLAKQTDIWTFPPSQRENRNGHPAPFPKKLPTLCILATTAEGDTVLDPFMGSGITAVACVRLNRNFIGMEINPDYLEIAKNIVQEEIQNQKRSRGESAPKKLSGSIVQESIF